MCTPVMASLNKFLFEQWVEQGLGVSFKGKGLKLDSQQDAADVVAAMKNCNCMYYLELEGNTLGIDAAIAIGKTLEGAPSFKAALWKDLFTGRLKTEIPKAMQYLFAGIDLAGAFLQRLDLSDNAIGPVGMVGLAPFFKSRSSFSLQELIVNNNGLGPEGGTSFANALMECLRLSKDAGGQIFQLKVFVCGRNRLENKAATMLATFFKECGSLEEIHIPQNGIYNAGLKAVSESFAFNENLTVINVNDNTMKGDAIDTLADSITKLHHLQELELGDCLLRDSGSVSIVKRLRNHKCIKKLVLESNEIGKEAGIEIAEIIRMIPSLQEINLGANEIGDRGVDQIINLLNSSGKKLLIEDDQGAQEGLAQEYYEDEETDFNNFYVGTTAISDDDGGQTEEENYFNEGGEAGEICNNAEQTAEDDCVISLPIIVSTMTLNTVSAESFIQTPTIEHYNGLKPDPLTSITTYLHRVANEETPYAELCIQASMTVISLFCAQGAEAVYHGLLLESLQNCCPNSFVTYLLVQLGFIKSEDKKFKVTTVPLAAIFALIPFVKEQPLPKIVLQCMQTFFSIYSEKPEFDKSAARKVLALLNDRLADWEASEVLWEQN